MFIKNNLIFKILLIFLILLQALVLPVYPQEPTEETQKEIIGVGLLKSDNPNLIKELKEKGFFIDSKVSKQIYAPYLSSPLPVYVTADSMLLSFNTLYRESISRVEEANGDKLLTFLKILSERAIGGLSVDIEEKTRIALEKNFLTLQLLIAILDKEPSELPPLAKMELSLIESANKIELSPILGVKIDYSELKAPEELNPKRAKLFSALAWMEHWQLNLNEELTANQAFLLLQDFAIDERLLLFWKEIDMPFSYLFGKVSGVEIEKLIPIIKYIFGSNPPTITELTEEHLKIFQRLTARINSENKAFSLFGKRMTLKEALKKSLDENLEITEIELVRMLKVDTTKGRNLKFREALLLWQEKNSQSHTSQLLNCFKALLYAKKDNRLPEFIYASEWQNSLGNIINISWLTSQAILASPTKSKIFSEGSNRYHEDFHGYVEPNADFFFQLKQTSSNLRDMLLKMRIFLPELDEFISISGKLENIARKQLIASSLSETDIDVLENFPEILAKLNFVAGVEQPKSFEQNFTLIVKDGSKSSIFSVEGFLTVYTTVTYKNKIYLCQGVLSKSPELIKI